MKVAIENKKTKLKRKIRAKINGTAERPRVSVFRSNRSVSVQFIDDVLQKTILSASDKTIKDAKTKMEKALKLGVILGQKACEKGIKRAVFDRSGYKYHGRIKNIAEGIRQGGLTI